MVKPLFFLLVVGRKLHALAQRAFGCFTLVTVGLKRWAMCVVSALPVHLECGLYRPNGKAEADITYFCRHFSEAHFLLVKDKKNYKTKEM